MDPLDIIDAARPAETTVSLCLRGDLVAEFELLEEALAAEKSKPRDDSLAGGGAMRELAEKIEALREEMATFIVTFRLRAMPRLYYRKLTDDHPPRIDADGSVHIDDARLQVNNETFFGPLIRACLVEPKIDAPRLTKLLDETLSDRQYEQLADAALLVNRGTVSVPKSLLASAVLENSEGA